MFVYGALILITCSACLFCSSSEAWISQRSKITISTFFIAYLILLCLRDKSVGVDVKGYLNEYAIIKNMSWSQLFATGVFIKTIPEYGFLVLTKLLGYFESERLYIIVLATICVLPVMYLYKNEGEQPLLICAFFMISLVFEMFFSGLRQSVAIACAVPAYYYARQRKPVKFALTVLLAASFHTSGILLTLIYVVYHFRFTTKCLWFALPATGAIYHYRQIIFDTFIKYSGDYYQYTYSYLTGTSGQTGLTVLFVLLCIYSYIIMDETKATEDDIGLRNLLFLSTCIHLFAPLHPLVCRVNFYFIIFFPLAISRVNAKRKDQYYQIVKVASFVMTTYFFMCFMFFKSDSLHVLDYTFFF